MPLSLAAHYEVRHGPADLAFVWVASTCRGAACSAAGVHTPILVVAASAAGNQMKAIEEVFAAFG